MKLNKTFPFWILSLSIVLISCESISSSSSNTANPPPPSVSSNTEMDSAPIPSSNSSDISPSVSSEDPSQDSSSLASQDERQESSVTSSTSRGAKNGSNDDPFANLENKQNSSPNTRAKVYLAENENTQNPPMTTAEKTAALDARLEEGFQTFDGMILSERESSQGNADGLGSTIISPQRSSNTEDEDISIPTIAIGLPDLSSGGAMSSSSNRNGQEGSLGKTGEAAYPTPDDIPNGNDDDIVARQLREAAMNEPDPELREALWNEYRSYTGISQ